MKSLLIASIGLGAATIIAAPALAQTINLPLVGPAQAYGALGYTNLQGDHADLSALQGRLGLRFDRYFGVEGELASGVNSHDPTTDSNGVPLKAGLTSQEAIYGVGFLPLGHNLDLFARAGYGGTAVKINSVTPTVYRYGGDSWNYGAGAQYFFNGGPNGVRADYTRYDYENNAPDANVWSVAFVRKF